MLRLALLFETAFLVERLVRMATVASGQSKDRTSVSYTSQDQGQCCSLVYPITTGGSRTREIKDFTPILGASRVYTYHVYDVIVTVHRCAAASFRLN